MNMRMMERDAIDWGTADIRILFRKFFVPTLLGMLSMSAVTAIDGIFVGHGVGSDGIAAVNICIPLLMIFTGYGLDGGVREFGRRFDTSGPGQGEGRAAECHAGTAVRNGRDAGSVGVRDELSPSNGLSARSIRTFAADG